MAASLTTSRRISPGLAASPILLPSLLSPQTAPQSSRHDNTAPTKWLWLCAYFPELPLETAGCEATNRRPVAIFEENSGRRLVYTASAAASAAGIVRGMPLAQTYALCPALEAQLRDTAAEKERLSRLAAWAGQFTPTVSLQPPQALLLEISASLQLFGGLRRLKTELTDGLSALGCRAHVAITPAPLASLLLASQRQTVELYEQEPLRSVLGKLPISVLPLDTDSIRRLICTGVRDLHDLWRLPREGLARRFGPELLNFLDRALGLRPDPCRVFHPLPRFAAELEMPWETDNTAVLLDAARCLLAKLGKFLRERDAGITRLRIDLYHAHLPPNRLRIGTRQSTRDEGHLLSLLKEHLNRFRLPAPVLKLRLATAAIQPFTANSQTLFPDQNPLIPSSEKIPPPPSFAKGGNGEISRDWPQLLDQLQTRLGREAVHGLEHLADHRPENAWNYFESGSIRHAADNRRRPLWLLANPQPLVSRQGHPWRRGPLSITKSPERIEGGWWDDRDIRRDYYIAKDTDGSRLWIFRELSRQKGWYLHGLFG